MYKATRNFRAKCTTGGGFTLAELLIVVAVIAVLVAVAVPTFGNQLEKSRQAVDVSNLRGAYAAARIKQLDNAKEVQENARHMHATNEVEDHPALTYTPYWYDPDTGELTLIKIVQTGGVNSSGNTDAKTFAQGKTTVLGKAQSATVSADTDGLPEFIRYETGIHDASDATTAEASNGIPAAGAVRGGTVDRAIRVVFYYGADGSVSINEIRFVGNGAEKVLQEGYVVATALKMTGPSTSTAFTYLIDSSAPATTAPTETINLADTITLQSYVDKDGKEVTPTGDAAKLSALKAYIEAQATDGSSSMFGWTIEIVEVGNVLSTYKLMLDASDYTVKPVATFATEVTDTTSIRGSNIRATVKVNIKDASGKIMQTGTANFTFSISGTST